MMRRPVDFIRDTERPSRLSTLVAVSAGVMLLGAGALLSWQQQGVETSAGRLQARQAVMAREQEQQAQALALMASRSSHLQDKRWKAALRQLDTPWFTVLGAIEESAVPPAYILATRLDPERGSVELELVAPQFNDALQMVDYLQHQAGLNQPRLVTREAPQAASPGSDSRFVIHAAWGVPHAQ